MKDISFIIPVYNEEDLIMENTRKLISYLQKFNFSYEIILASNGSDDETVVLGERLAMDYPVVKFFHIEQKGVGRVFKRAVTMSYYDYIISLDMDLSIDLSYIDEALGLLDEYDLVIGSKKTGVQKRSFFRKIPSFIFIFLTKILLGLSYEDYSLAAKTYKKDIILKNIDRIDYGTSYVIDLIYFAKKQGYNIIQVPVMCFDNRTSKFNILNESLYRLKNLIRLWLSRNTTNINK